MYDQSIINRKLEIAEKNGQILYGPEFRIVRFSRDESIRNTESIQALWTPEGRLLRPLQPEEEEFIRNEQILYQNDFRYWFERQLVVERDSATGELGRVELWGSQSLIYEHLAAAEHAMWESFWEQKLRGYSEDDIRVKGIIVVLPKARQLGATVFSEAAVLHRSIYSRDIRCVIASADEEKSIELFNTKYLAFYDRLPFWSQPKITSKQQDGGLKFGGLNVSLLLQHGAQEKGVGQGGTTMVSHLTELGSWWKPDLTIKKHFLGSIPWTLQALSIWESTGEDIGTWFHRFVMQRWKQSDKGDDEASRVVVVFVPWYAHAGKYRLPAPIDWSPSSDTIALANRIKDTSPRYFNGRTVTPHRDQLYWYEINRKQALSDGELPFFLSDYPTVLEEAFQSTRIATFNPVVLNRLSLTTQAGKRMEFAGESGKLRPAELMVAPGDPRGILYIWEPPRAHANYVQGVDATLGIPNWCRALIKDGDDKTDNFATELFRVGEYGEPDVQVAEFAAPIPPEDAAFIVNFLGKLYHGRDPDGALTIVETYPSPGQALQDRLISEFSYWNLWKRTDVSTERLARDYGWMANDKSVTNLWARVKPHLSSQRLVKGEGGVERLAVRVILRSEHLISEMQTAESDVKLMKAKAEYGFHDDRLRASMLALLAAHDWSTYDPTAPVKVIEQKALPDYQRTDLTAEEMGAKISERLGSIMNGGLSVIYRGRRS